MFMTNLLVLGASCSLIGSYKGGHSLEPWARQVLGVLNANGTSSVTDLCISEALLWLGSCWCCAGESRWRPA